MKSEGFKIFDAQQDHSQLKSKGTIQQSCQYKNDNEILEESKLSAGCAFAIMALGSFDIVQQHFGRSPAANPKMARVVDGLAGPRNRHGYGDSRLCGAVYAITG